MSKITAFKNGIEVQVELGNGDYHKAKQHDMLDPTRIWSCDTESQHSTDGNTYTICVQLSRGLPLKQVDDSIIDIIDDLEDLASNKHRDETVILDTWKDEVPFIKLLDHIFPLCSEDEIRPTRTVQRTKTKVKSNGNPDGRNGRRQKLNPIVISFYNGEYDLGRLFRNNPQFSKAALLEDDNVRFPLGTYEIEVCQLTPFGSSPRFDFHIRKDGMILKILGRDMWAYWKSGLGASAKSLGLDFEKDDLEAKLKNSGHNYRQLFKGMGASGVLYEEWTETERRIFFDYAANDARATRALFLMTTKLLVSMSDVIIRKDGVIPVSAPNASAVLCFNEIDWSKCPYDPDKIMAAKRSKRDDIDDEKLRVYSRPCADILQYGADAYAGGRVFSLLQGIIEDPLVNDIDSCYPYWMSQIPDPVTSIYREIFEGESIENLKGKFGIIKVSGEGLDNQYPALRCHDKLQGGRLRGIYGPFENISTTIMEAVVGVVSGRLRIDTIHGGYWMDGKKEDSFIRKHILKLHLLKTTNTVNGVKNAIALMSKLLMNSLYGKFAELNQRNPFMNSVALEIPAISSTLITQEIYDMCDRAYVKATRENELDALEDAIRTVDALIRKIHASPVTPEIFDEYTDMCNVAVDAKNYEASYAQFQQTVEKDDIDETTIFRDWFNKFQDTSVQAGRYYNPFIGALITGHASAQLGVWTACLKSKQADTDSGMGSRGNEETGKTSYYHIMEASGYEAPTSGLGSFACEVGSYREGAEPQTGDTIGIEAVFIRSKAYSIMYLEWNGTDWITKYKNARHGIGKPEIGIPRSDKTYKRQFGEYVHNMFRDFIHQRKDEQFCSDTTAKVEYTEQAKPRPVRFAYIHNYEPGVFSETARSFQGIENPHMNIDKEGNRTWKKMTAKEDILEASYEKAIQCTVTKARLVHKNEDFLYQFTVQTTDAIIEIEQNRCNVTNKLFQAARKHPVPCTLIGECIVPVWELTPVRKI